MNPQERVLTSRLAAHKSWANTADRSARTEAARRASESRFVVQARELHPHGTAQQIEDAAQSLRKAHFTRLALLSAQARRVRREISGA
jgi:cellobiose-specific phosphotransferase system component IIA